MQRIELELEGTGGTLVMYLHDAMNEMTTYHLKRPCVLVFPGGGYHICSERESDPPALALFAHGYNVGILYYGLDEQAAGLLPLRQGVAAVRTIRRNAQAWNIQQDNIAVLGFSAGAHAAASVGTLCDDLQEAGDLVSARPNAMVLCYPVLTTGPFTHEGSAQNVSGGDPQLRAYLSLEDRVDPKTPPAFLWHTFDDQSVPLENTLMFINALRASNVPFECHIYPSGTHGLSMCNMEVHTPNEHCSTWFNLCLRWLDEQFGFQQ